MGIAAFNCSNASWEISISGCPRKTALFGSTSVAPRLVAISCSRRAEDRLVRMKERRLQRNYNFDYLIDLSQKTGRRYGATVTPQFFVLNQKRKIAYMGAFDDHLEPDKVEERYVRDAVRALLAGKPVDVAESRARGCEIEYADTSPEKAKEPAAGSGTP